jgi:midasin (ATPase involved in ribosome maturation)
MNKQMVKPFLKSANKKAITYVFIIIDSMKNSILNIKTVEYINGKMEIKSYMNDFPFDYFLVINDAK